MRYILLFVITLTSVLAYSQENTAKARRLIEIGDGYFAAQQYIEAVPNYKEALVSDEKNMRAQFRLAECYRFMQDYQSAEYYYGLIAEDQDVRFPLSGFYFALMQKLGGRYDEALESFKKFNEFMVREGF